MEVLWSYFTSPEKRLYWGFLLSSTLLAYFYLIVKHQKIDLRYFFSKRYLFHPSSLLDLKIFILNFLLKTFLFSTIFISAYKLAVIILRQLRQLTPDFNGLDVSDLVASIIVTVFSFVLIDFLRFALHKIMHKYLWRFHRVHHSAEVLTPLTLFRAHPVEVFLSQLRNLLGQTLVLVFMAYFFAGQIGMIDIIGVNAFGFLFNLVGSNLRHGHIPISFGPLEHIFVSPRMHQLHHSKKQEHYNLNFGTVFSLWDKLFKSFHLGVANNLEFGVEGLEKEKSRELWASLS